MEATLSLGICVGAAIDPFLHSLLTGRRGREGGEYEPLRGSSRGCEELTRFRISGEPLLMFGTAGLSDIGILKLMVKA